MRHKLLIIIICCMCLPCITYSQDNMPIRNVELVSDGVIVTYRFPQIRQQECPSFPQASYWKIPGFPLNDVEGEPAVPFHWDTFAVPEGATASVEVIDSAFVDVEGEIAPAYPPILSSDTLRRKRTTITPVNPFEGWLPRQSVLMSGLQHYRTQPILRVATLPVKYNYINRTVRQYSMLKYKITFTASDGNKLGGRVSPTNKTRISCSDHFLDNIALNYKREETNLKTRLAAPAMRDNLTSEEDTRSYKIITTYDFQDAVEQFVKWKRTQGFDVTVYYRTKGNWTVNDVKTAVGTNANTAPDFLLIVGDIDFVPNTYHSYYDGGSINYYSDFDYACYIMYNDYVANFPYGRIPARSLTEATNALNKIVKYEKEPNNYSSFYNNVTGCSVFEAYYMPHGDGYALEEASRALLTTEEIHEYMLNKGKNHNRIYTPYYTNLFPKVLEPDSYWSSEWGPGTAIPSYLEYPNFQWDGTGGDIVDAINNGTFLLTMVTHGNYYIWSAPNFTIDSIQGLSNNNKYPVIFSMSCRTGLLNGNSTTFPGAFMGAQNSGSVAFIAPTFDTYFGITETILEGMINAMWPNPGMRSYLEGSTVVDSTTVPIYEIGAVMNMGKDWMGTININNHGTFATFDEARYIYQQNIFHCYGDPSMMVTTEVPRSFNTPYVSFDGLDVTVQTQEDSVRISFYEYLESEQTVRSFVGNYAEFNAGSDTVLVCLEKHNYKPYIFKITPDLYIQNKTITENNEYYTHEAKIGTNVTNTQPTGDVVINMSNIVIHADTVEIHPNTTIKKSNFTIITSQ